jgi:hypothetical protein
MVQKYNKVFFLIFLLLLIYYRSPYIFNEGRFLSIDLNYHLKISSLSLIESFFYFDYGAHYINFISNISSIISTRFFDLYSAQYTAVYLSLITYTVILFYILFKELSLFTKIYQKYLFATLIVLAPVMNFEIWLNAANLQVYFGILTLIIFFLRPEKINKKLIYFFLVIGGLSGVYSCALFPIFLLRYLKNKVHFDLINSLILISCSIIQLFIIYISKLKFDTMNLEIVYGFSKFEAISFLYNIILRPFFGSTLPKFFLELFNLDLYRVLNDNNVYNLLFYISISTFILLALIILWIIKSFKEKSDKYQFFYLTISFIIISFVVAVGGVSDSLHGRYSTIPGIILILMVLYISANTKSNFLKTILFILILSSIFFGFLDYRLEKYLVYLDCLNCPDWNDEVTKYFLDKNYQMNAWPYHINR